MRTPSKLKSFLFAVLSAVTVYAQALEIKPYDEAAFQKSQAAGQAAVLMFHATWCSTCKLQEKSLDSLKADADLKNIIVYKADFDNSAALQKAYKVRDRSTLVVVKGAKEVDRLTAVTQVEPIKTLLKKAL